MKIIKEMIEVMQAFADDKTIEVKSRSSLNDWRKCDNPTWNWGQFDYRIKQEPQCRPWNAEEVPVGKVIVHKVTRNKFVIHSMIREDRAGYYVMIGTVECRASKIWNEFTMEDGSPCGVKVE